MESIMENLATYGYVALFIYSLGGGFVGLIAAGVLSSMGYLDLFVSLAVAFAANFIGDMILFYLGRYNKREIMPYLRRHRRKLALSHLLMKRHGNRILIFQKFVYGLKTLVPVAIGLTRYDLRSFALYNLIGAFLWALVFGVGSFLAGDFFRRLADSIGENPVMMPVALAAILGTIYLFFHLATRKKARR
ncbi:MAG: DedA family protein [Campylobacterales bacterium]